MRRALLPFLAGCLALSAFAAAAQDWPSKPIRIVVPFPSGGTTDTAVRPLAERLSQQLGVSVVVENKPGAAGRIGYDFAAKAAPDGYTLLAGTDSLGLQPHLDPPPNYDPIRDFAPIAQLSSQPLVIAVHPSLGVTTLQQLVELGRTKREPIGYATSGIGSSQNFAGEWFARVSGLKMLHVPYRGGGQAVNDLLAGQVQLAVLGIAPLIPYQKAGRIRILAVTTAERSPALPDVPTLKELGYDVVVDQWMALLAPAKVPPAILERLNAEVNTALRDPRLREIYAGVAMRPVGGTAQDLDTLLKSDYRRFGTLTKELNFKAE
ncbi:Bug family tripartite tricarboxylate transporter substrate binding protein [Reyranella sp.]|uniref:Bug family tripartite tricarboxylate transporter substrate binding protein n=1 Tax=Reyranella sp. TaxID=1929291 RepID=UPI003BAABB7B